MLKELLMQYHTAFYLTKPKVYCPHIVCLSCMNSIVTSLLTLNGEDVTARILMLILVQDKVGCLRLCYLTFSTKRKNSELSQHCGISINKNSYNVFCYADDLILTSLTITGPQSLINISRNYITSHGLNFNPSKTTCTTFGTTHQVVNPTWSLNGVKLKQDESVTYLGTRLSNQTRDHIDSRITAARCAFYGLQGAGLCVRSANPNNCTHV